MSADMLRAMVNGAVFLSDSKQDILMTVSPVSQSLHKIYFDKPLPSTGKTTDPEWELLGHLKILPQTTYFHPIVSAILFVGLWYQPDERIDER